MLQIDSKQNNTTENKEQHTNKKEIKQITNHIKEKRND